MPRIDSTLTTLAIAAVMAGGIGYAVHNWSRLNDAIGKPVAAKSTPGEAIVAPKAAVPRAQWAASAPGRIEPIGGEVRVGAQSSGQVAEVVVRANDRVAAGDLLVRLDDIDPIARLSGAEAEVAVRRRERDAETVGRLATDRRNSEDQVAASERALAAARNEADRAFRQRREGAAADEVLVKARAAVTAAKDKLEQDRTALRKLQATTGMPLQTRLEASVATARSELSVLEAALERTRIRAPSDGTVMQVNVKVGETVAANPEMTVISFGDLSKLRVRAEVEERDAAKIRIGQKAIVRSDAFPGKDFTGVVASIAQSLAPPRLASRGPRRPNDVDVLEVLIDLEGQTPVMPGMRADVFFVADATVQQTQPATSTN